MNPLRQDNVGNGTQIAGKLQLRRTLYCFSVPTAFTLQSHVIGGTSMLLRFGVKNYRSLKSYQELSLIASSLDDNPLGLIENEASPGEKILPAAIIYGANASGKSNLIRALSYMRGAVLFSHNRNDPGGGIPYKPFALDPKCASKPSSFDLDFIHGGVRYHYGFEQSDKVFEKEWLYAFPNGKRRILFEREGSKFSFSRNLKGQNEVISNLTRPNSLFASAAAQNNHAILSQVVNFFRAIRSEVPLSANPVTIARREMNERSMKKTLDLLTELGTGAIAYRKRKVEIPPETSEFFSDFDVILKKHLKDITFHSDISGRFELAHRGYDGKEIYFDLDEESEGTRRLLILLDEVFIALDLGSVLLIDELNASLHTQACERIISLFSIPTINTRGAQLVGTTHDTNLLISTHVRRDEVWFTEQQSDGSTELFPLTDIKTRKGDNIERGYLQGRYGAVPFPMGRSVLAEGK
jgi:AAA15 family ATPase/GTPase